MRDAISLVRLVFQIVFGLISLVFRILGFLLGLFSRRPGGLPRTFLAEVRVVDGDSLVAQYEGREIKIRLHGIDAPEFGQAEGADSTRTLRKIVGSGPVGIYPVETDHYKRVVARVFTPEGVDVAQAMVRQGHALASYSNRYESDERAARSAGTGFWANGGIVDPAEWRAARRS